MNKYVIARAILLGTALVSPYLGLGQETFGDLDFESPIPPLNRDIEFTVPIANALPGWNGYIGNTQVDRVVYDTIALDSAAISLHDAASDSLQPLAGDYSVFLQGSSIFAPPASAAIAQNGRIPGDALLLLFFASSPLSFRVTFAGQEIPLAQVGNGANYVIMGGDVSGFSGLTGELRFTALPQSGGLLDNIAFQPIPEPSVLGLLVFGCLLFRSRGAKK